MGGNIIGKGSLRIKKIIVMTVVVAGILSCNKEENEQIVQGKREPLQIGAVKFSDKEVNSIPKNMENKNNAVQSEGLECKDAGYMSSDSSIKYTGCSPWDNFEEQGPGNEETNVLRSSDSNLKSKGIGIFRLSDTNYPVAQNNIHYAYNYDESIWDPSDKSNPVYLSKNNATLCAYYPYNIASDNGNVTLASQPYSDDADICYQTGQTASSESGSVLFTLNHAYAKITFNFTRDETYTGAGKISNIKIAGDSIRTENTLNIETGKYGYGTLGAVSLDPGIATIAAGETQSTSILLVPVKELKGEITITLTIDGREKTGVFIPSEETFTSFSAGNNYTFNIDLAGTLVIITGETANSYMLSPGISIGIPVNVKGNGDSNAVAGTGLDVHHTAASVGILWETTQNLISLSGFTTESQTVHITANNITATGNVVIAAYSGENQTGDILWSWHIWVTDYNPDSSTVQNGNIYTIANTNGSYTWMDRNLGATTTTPASTTTLGLLYQWGRKDPFPGANNYYISENNVYTSLPIYNENGTVLTEESGTSGTGIKHTPTVETTRDKTLNLKNSIKNPMMFYYGIEGSNIGYDWYTATDGMQYQNDALWGGADNTMPAEKTIFDPCPPGWRVPAWNGVTPWSAFTTSTFTWTTSNYGRTYNSETFYPATGYRNCGSGALSNLGSYGCDWSASISSVSQYSYNLSFDSGGIYLLRNYNRAHGFSVRCVRE